MRSSPGSSVMLLLEWAEVMSRLSQAVFVGYDVGFTHALLC